jgi:hypothetical protein
MNSGQEKEFLKTMKKSQKKRPTVNNKLPVILRVFMLLVLLNGRKTGASRSGISFLLLLLPILIT